MPVLNKLKLCRHFHLHCPLWTTNKSTSRRSSGNVLDRRKLLDGAKDWKLLADFAHDFMVFPPEIISTSLRPDIVVWSSSLRRVLLFELTCPAEEGIDTAKLYKEAKYGELSAAISGAGWSVELRSIEVGARGFVAHSVPRLLRDLGYPTREVSTLCRSLSTVVAKCSYTVYLARSEPEWRVPDLLQL